MQPSFVKTRSYITFDDTRYYCLYSIGCTFTHRGLIISPIVLVSPALTTAVINDPALQVHVTAK